MLVVAGAATEVREENKARVCFSPHAIYIHILEKFFLFAIPFLVFS